MAEQEQQAGPDVAPAGTDETLRRYLLCRLEEDESLRIDERLLVDDELAERIVLVESELTDDYAAGRLDAAELEAFTKRFLVTEERKQQLRFTSALQDYSRSQTLAPVAVITRRDGTSWRESLASLFGARQPTWAIAGSLAVLILLVGLAWFVATQRHDSTPITARRESPVPALSPQASPQDSVPRGADAPSTSPTPARKSEPIPSPAEPPATIVSFVLLPGAVRGDGQLARVAVPRGQRDVVRLSLSIEDAAGAGDYQAELTTAEGQAVALSGKLKVESGNRVVLPIPARQLHSRDYQIKLTRRNEAGQTETVGRYYFRALKN